jgi:ABC-type lipoprotein release transport system permease subunit
MATLHLGPATDPAVSYVRVEQIIAITVIAGGRSARGLTPPPSAVEGPRSPSHHDDIITPVNEMSLAAMQEVLESPGKCTYILVKLEEGADVDAVAARINEALPGNKINLTRDLVIDAQDRVPALKTFLRVLVGLGAFVSTIFVLLSMYTTVTERRKEIGILKSLGASKGFIVKTIEGEAFMIGVFGVLLGFFTAFAASFAIGRGFDLAFEFSINWVITAIFIAIGGSLIGALYPAWKASSQPCTKPKLAAWVEQPCALDCRTK